MAAAQHGFAKLMVSYGGKIQRCPEGGQPRYIGGEHWVIGVKRSVSLRDLRHRLAARVGCSNISVQYVLPGEDLDALRDVVTDDHLRDLLDWVLYRDLQIRLLRTSPAEIPRVPVFLVRHGRPPLAPAPSTKGASPASSSANSKKIVSPSLRRRSVSAPLLSTESTDRTPPSGSEALLSPALIGRSTSSPSLSAKSTENDTAASATTTTAAVGTSATRDMVSPAPVFLVPVAPVIVYRPVIPMYQGFVVPAFGCSVVVLCGA